VATLTEKVDAVVHLIGIDIARLLKANGNASLDGIASRLDTIEQAWRVGFSEIILSQGKLADALAAIKAKTNLALDPSLIDDNAVGEVISQLPVDFVYGRYGLNRFTGKPLTGWEHCAQSIRDIITTPIGTRVMRRDYGSRIMDLIDRPMLQDTLFEATAIIAEALETWEPRFKLKRVWINGGDNTGRLEVSINGIYYPRGHVGDFSVSEGPGNIVVRIGG
jgi:uncharacterized protein